MKSYIANKDLEGCKFVKFAGGVENATASNDYIIGVSDTVKVAAGCIADIALAGEVVPILAGAPFAAGEALTSDSTGCAIPASSGDNIGAIALQPAEAKEDIALVVVQIQRTIKVESLEQDNLQTENGAQ